ncbi:hypothetical protein MMC25_001355 [Agyrium rufum]|nr:hypothetical protein [Agyrium rufum]
MSSASRYMTFTLPLPVRNIDLLIPGIVQSTHLVYHAYEDTFAEICTVELKADCGTAVTTSEEESYLNDLRIEYHTFLRVLLKLREVLRDLEDVLRDGSTDRDRSMVQETRTRLPMFRGMPCKMKYWSPRQMESRSCACAVVKEMPSSMAEKRMMEPVPYRGHMFETWRSRATQKMAAMVSTGPMWLSHYTAT